jgi:hypothetical protein
MNIKFQVKEKLRFFFDHILTKATLSKVTGVQFAQNKRKSTHCSQKSGYWGQYTKFNPQ